MCVVSIVTGGADKGGTRFSYSISSGTGEEGYVEDEDYAIQRSSVGDEQTAVEGGVAIIVDTV